MSKQNNDATWLVFVILLFLGALVSAMLSGPETTTKQAYTPDRSSTEYRYVKERVKLEGYSDKEAAQAADAIMKFHKAQQNR